MLAQPIQSIQRSYQNNAQSDEAVEFWKRVRRLRISDDPRTFEDLVLGLIFLRGLSDPAWPGAEVSEELSNLHDLARWPKIVECAMDSTGRSSSKMIAASARALALTQLFECAAKVDECRLSELVLLINDIGSESGGPLRELLPQAFDGCLNGFAALSARAPGNQATPECIAELMVELADPIAGTIYDPCCGAGGLLIRAWHHAARQSVAADLHLHGRECSAFYWRAAKMSAVLRGVPLDLGPRPFDVFGETEDSAIHADVVLAAPPFNQRDWSETPFRTPWAFGVPPNANANFAWLQHVVEHMSPCGRAVVAMSSSSLTSEIGDEGGIRRRILDADLVDCIIALPGGIFPAGRASACLWVLSNDKAGGRTSVRNRRGETLFINAQFSDQNTSRTTPPLNPLEQARVVSAYRAWKSDKRAYSDISGFCRSVTRAEIGRKNEKLLSGLYVRSNDEFDADCPSTSLRTMVDKLNAQFDESRRLETLIREKMQVLFDA